MLYKVCSHSQIPRANTGLTHRPIAIRIFTGDLLALTYSSAQKLRAAGSVLYNSIANGLHMQVSLNVTIHPNHSAAGLGSH